MAENWKADAEGILIFVRLSFNLVLHTDSLAIDRFILCCCCILTLSVDSGYSTGPTGHLQLLPRQHISDSFRPKSIQYLKFPSCFSSPIFTTKLRCLGERTLVLEFGDQSYMCPTCDLAPTMGTKISQSHPASLRSAQAGTASCIPCRRSS